MEDDWYANRLDEAEQKAFFDQLFPNGFAGEDVLAEIAPEGWGNSPMLACFHPSPEQVHEEALHMHRNLQRLSEIGKKRNPEKATEPPRPEPTLKDILEKWEESPVKTGEEVTDLVGLCLWDIFSDNHEVIADDGRIVDIGSFRGAAGFLVEYLEGPSDDEIDFEKLKELGGSGSLEDALKMGDLFNMDYCRFYMGTSMIGGRADLTPVYLMIFRRIQALGGDWEYHFPELNVIDLSHLKDQGQGPAGYSPSEAFAKEQERKEKKEELEKMREGLAKGNREAREEAMDRAPPPTILAYNEVFGKDPKGWPPA